MHRSDVGRVFSSGVVDVELSSGLGCAGDFFINPKCFTVKHCALAAGLLPLRRRHAC